MLEKQRKIIDEFLNKKHYTLQNFIISFGAKDFEDLIDKFSEYLRDDFEYILNDEVYLKHINFFMLDILNKIEEVDEFYIGRSLFLRFLDTCKDYMKPYHKKEKKKDEKYTKCNKLKEILSFDLYNIDILLEEYKESKTMFKTIKFIIFELKNPDYLYRIIQEQPDIVNITNNDSVSLFEYITTYYIDNAYTLNNDDMKYFKRIIMMLLESDNLHVKNNVLANVVDRCNNLNSITYSSSLNYLKEIVIRHFPNLSGSDKTNCVNYTQVESPIDIVSKDPGERIDLRNVFTITIDGLRNKKLDNVLFDDCFALTGSGNDLHILVSVPDVDLIIDRDSEIDSYMRSLGESVYVKGNEKALLDRRFAREISLEKDKDRNTLTFDISVDSEGNVKCIDFYKSIVRVNYNFNKDVCDQFMKYNDFDERLNVLRKMYDLAVKLCRKRKDVIGRRSPAKVIMDEFNILPDLQTAKFFNDNGIVFPYKNYFGKLRNNSRKHIVKVHEFIKNNHLDEESSELISSVINTFKYPFYDTIFVDNKAYHGFPCGSVGNPMREYISLESDRLIKDIVIDNKNNEDYWKERIERDCIEYTATSAKIRELYNNNNKRGR